MSRPGGGGGTSRSSQSQSSQLDGVHVIRKYLDKIIYGDGKLSQGQMKVLLLDASTTQIVSAIYSQTEILQNSVYLVRPIEKQTQTNQNSMASDTNTSTNHLKAVCFIRPTPTNIELLCQEITSNTQNSYSEYHVFFSSFLSSGLLRKLAEADATKQKIQQVQEYYADFLPVNNDLWTLQCRSTLQMTVSAGTSWAPKHAVQYERNLQGLQAMLLAMKKQPYCIRYAKHSPCAEELAKDLHDGIVQDELFHFRNTSSVHHQHGGNAAGLLLLVLDRRDDPITPLLSQWTYQAMVHELLGLNNHRVNLRGAPNIGKDLEEVVLSAASDDFFAKHKYDNFGELGEAIQKMLYEYQNQTKQHNADNLNSIEEMQNFMDKFPELRSRSHVVSKHVAIMGELARLVDVCKLMDVSQFEQSLACNDDHASHWRELLEKLQSPSIKVPDKLRLGLLYAIRYENSANLHMVQQAMNKGGVPSDMVKLLPVMLHYGGNKARSPGLLFGDQHANLMTRMTKNFVGAVQGIDNVYSQHVPLVMETLNSIQKGKLSPKDYPIVPGSAISSSSSSGTSKKHHHPDPSSSSVSAVHSLIPNEVLVFMVGGVTYEEGTKISEFNNQNRGRIQVVLAGSTVHNSTSFLDELKATAI